MAVKEIEYYTQKDGREILKVILNPTKKYPNGYFYVDRYFEELVRKYTWFIVADRTNDYVKAGIGSVYRRTNILLHQEIHLTKKHDIFPKLRGYLRIFHHMVEH